MPVFFYSFSCFGEEPRNPVHARPASRRNAHHRGRGHLRRGGGVPGGGDRPARVRAIQGREPVEVAGAKRWLGGRAPHRGAIRRALPQAGRDPVPAGNPFRVGARPRVDRGAPGGRGIPAERRRGLFGHHRIHRGVRAARRDPDARARGHRENQLLERQRSDTSEMLARDVQVHVVKERCRDRGEGCRKPAPSRGKRATEARAK